MRRRILTGAAAFIKECGAASYGGVAAKTRKISLAANTPSTSRRRTKKWRK